MSTARDLYYLNGYDERRRFYGGDDDDIRMRLNQLGKAHIDENIRVAHVWRETAPRRDKNFVEYEPFGQRLVLPNLNFGADFNRIAYSKCSQ